MAARDLATRDDRVHVVETAGAGAIDLKGLALRLPNGTPLVNADGFSLRKGERTLVTGPSGSGKSTLFRAIAGIWPFGAGSIAVPAGATLMMLPQRPYFPTGSLRGAVEYPAKEGTFTDSQISSAIEAVGLPKLASQLDENGHWNRTLSLGEQQRLGLVRALLHTPNYLFLDEATASLDEPSEAALYRLLEEKLPQTTIVSIGHRSTLDAFHQRNVSLVRDGERFTLRDAGEPPSRSRVARMERSAIRESIRLREWPGLRCASSGLRSSLNPAPRPGLAAHPAVPEIGERGQQHRAGQHRRQQERRWQIA